MHTAQKGTNPLKRLLNGCQKMILERDIQYLENTIVNYEEQLPSLKQQLEEKRQKLREL